MKFKLLEYKNQLDKAHPMLGEIVVWVDRYCQDKFNKEITITGVERTREDSINLYTGKEINPKTGKLYLPDDVPVSVHEVKPCRGADIRASDFTHDQCLNIQYAVNSHFLYDPDRLEKKVCLYHAISGNSVHFHLQVTDKTREV